MLTGEANIWHAHACLIHIFNEKWCIADTFLLVAKCNLLWYIKKYFAKKLEKFFFSFQNPFNGTKCSLYTTVITVAHYQYPNSTEKKRLQKTMRFQSPDLSLKTVHDSATAMLKRGLERYNITINNASKIVSKWL